MTPIFLVRPQLLEDGEIEAIRRYFPVTVYRSQLGFDRLVVGRLSTLPHYDEYAMDVRVQGSRAINSLQEHSYAADLGAYYGDIQDLTFPTWHGPSGLPRAAREEAPFVLKGATNSMKHLWATHMFAATWEDAVQVYARLLKDSLISQQSIYLRKYVELRTFWQAAGGMRITEEYRVFVYKGQELSRGFYWNAFAEDLKEEGVAIPDPSEIPSDWLKDAISRVKDRVPFFAIDVARDVCGRWWVVEINDGQQAGLCGNDPEQMYSALFEALPRTPYTAPVVVPLMHLPNDLAEKGGCSDDEDAGER